MTKIITLTQNQYAIVDDENYNKLNRYKWHAQYDPKTVGYYALRNTPTKNGRQTKIRMHRVVTNAPRGKQVDHINHDTLDNRKQNLRLCTQSQNNMNRVERKNFVSKYKGVCLSKRKYKDKVYTSWMARIRIDGKLIYLGAYKSEIQAAHAYDKQAKELFGKFALLNFKVVE